MLPRRRGIIKMSRTGHRPVLQPDSSSADVIHAQPAWDRLSQRGTGSAGVGQVQPVWDKPNRGGCIVLSSRRESRSASGGKAVPAGDKLCQRGTRPADV